jgi:hypothetical protein
MKSIIELAEQAGFEIDCCSLQWHERIERFAALVRAAVIEDAAGIAEEELANSNALAAYNTVQRIRALKTGETK